MSNSVQVRILGRDYTLRSQQDVDQVRRVAAFVEERIAETASGRSVDTQDLTVLTLLNLAGEFLQVVETGNRQNRQLLQLVEQLEAVDSGC